METKTQALLNGSNRVYDAINKYNNELVAKANALLAGYGINEAVVDTAHLTGKQKGALLRGLAAFLDAIGKEAAERVFEPDLIAAGFTGVDDAIAQIPEHFQGQTAQFINVNFTKTKELVALLDTEVMKDATLIALLSMIVNIKNKVAEIAPQMNRV